MPPLVRLYIRSIAFGFTLAALFTGLLVWLDIAHLRHLVLSSDMGWLAVIMLVIFNGIIFSGVQFGFAVMRMAESSPPGPRLRQHLPAPQPVPVRVPVPQDGVHRP